MQGEQVSEMSLPAGRVAVLQGFTRVGLAPAASQPRARHARVWGMAPGTSAPVPSPAPGQAESSAGGVVHGSSQLHAARRFPSLPLCKLATSPSNNGSGAQIPEALGGEEEEEEGTGAGC